MPTINIIKLDYQTCNHSINALRLKSGAIQTKPADAGFSAISLRRRTWFL